MDKERQQKLRTYYHSLNSQKQIFGAAGIGAERVVPEPTVRPLQEEIGRLEHDLPNVIPPFNMSSYKANYVTRGLPNYYADAISGYLSSALARLAIEMDVEDSTPVTESRDFSFVNDADLRRILERDDQEIQRAFISGCWKSVIILSGGAIEAILVDILSSNAPAARSATKAPKKADIRAWDLADLINVAVELDLLTAGVEKLSHSLREYRNLVHPGNEIRNKLLVEREEAKIALEVLNMVHRELSGP